uniref:Putative secreted protein n=1 Tax=Ixodes ricinus TaxID=34613 RepID=A0A6B0U849_IXORI
MSIWCRCRKKPSLSCFLASWCFSCRCRSSSSHSAASRARNSCCFCCKNCFSRSAIFSRWLSLNRFMDSSCCSFSFSTNNRSRSA